MRTVFVVQTVNVRLLLKLVRDGVEMIMRHDSVSTSGRGCGGSSGSSSGGSSSTSVRQHRARPRRRRQRWCRTRRDGTLSKLCSLRLNTGGTVMLLLGDRTVRMSNTKLMRVLLLLLVGMCSSNRLMLLLLLIVMILLLVMMMMGVLLLHGGCHVQRSAIELRQKVTVWVMIL